MTLNIKLSGNDIKELFSIFKKSNIKTKIVICVVAVLILAVMSFGLKSIFDKLSITIKDYAPQSIGNNSTGNLQIQGENVNVNTPPPLQLSYKIEKEQREDNLYRTIFSVKITRPPGNFQERFNINPKIKSANCSEAKWHGSATMSNGAIIRDEFEYSVECTSKEPITDTGNLFSL